MADSSCELEACNRRALEYTNTDIELLVNRSSESAWERTEPHRFGYSLDSSEQNQPAVVVAVAAAAAAPNVADYFELRRSYSTARTALLTRALEWTQSKK